MANRIFQAVWDFGPENRTEMLVLMALADSANADTAECFPSFRTIGLAARASRRTVIATLQRLKADGWISYDADTRDNGSQTSNVYRINIHKLGLDAVDERAAKVAAKRQAARAAKGGAKTAPPRAKTAPPPVQKLHPTGGAKTAPLEQTISNKGPAALNMDLEKVTPFQRSQLLAGRPVLVGGQLVAPATPEAESLCAALRAVA